MSDQPRLPRLNRKLMWIGISLIIIILLTSGSLVSSTVEPFRAIIVQWNAHFCGTIEFKRDTHIVANTVTSFHQSDTCITQAAASCRAATLVVVSPGLDTLLTDTFVVEPPMGLNRSCRLVVTWHNEVDAGDIQRSGVDVCSGVSEQTATSSRKAILQFLACGWQSTVTIPSPT